MFYEWEQRITVRPRPTPRCTEMNLKQEQAGQGIGHLKEAKYGYRNQMGGEKDFAVKNYYNFPPYCYAIVEPLR